MSFMSEMLSEPGETEKNRLLNEAQTTQTIGNDKNKPAELLPREAEVIAYLDREEGRKLTQQEVNLALDQARDIPGTCSAGCGISGAAAYSFNIGT